MKFYTKKLIERIRNTYGKAKKLLEQIGENKAKRRAAKDAIDVEM